jgi:sortase A
MLCRAERIAWSIALVLIAGSAAVGLVGGVVQDRRLAAFDDAMEQAAPLAGGELAPGALSVAPPDRSDWSASVSRKYQLWRASYGAPPVAVLKIPAIGIEAEIFGNTDRRSLDLGVGRIEGTASPGESGNIGLAGHRDGYFRRLKDIGRGQAIQVLTVNGRWEYEVESIRIVKPSDVGALAPTANATVTLVTCYPFYFLGHAPWRYIVQGRLVSQTLVSPHGNTRTST